MSKALLGAVTLVVFAPLNASAQLQVFFGNLHSHTSYSDGRGTPLVAYAHARDVAGLDFLAITEHNHRWAPSQLQTSPELYNGPQPTSLISAANSFTVNGTFVALYGQEFSSIGTGNHANVLEVGDVIMTSDVPNGNWSALVDTWLPNHLDSQGQTAILLLNHPATSNSPNTLEYGIDANDLGGEAGLRARLDPHAQLINIINGPSHSGDTPGEPSEGEFLRYLNMGLHLAPTADQDNHREDWGSVVDTRTGVVTTSLTKPDLLAAMRARHVYATQDRNLRIIVTYNGELMGTRFQGAQVPAVGSRLNIQVDVADDDEPFAFYTFDVFSDVVGGNERAEVVAQFEADGDGTFSLDGITYSGGNQYFFIRVAQSDDDGVIVDSAWTAPVWFEPTAVTPATTPTTSSVILAVDLVAERATITNNGTNTVDLSGWRLVSVLGNQQFTFPDMSLSAGQSVVVTSGPSATHNPPATLRWTTAHVWRNAGDPGRLLDANNVVRAESQ